MLQPDVNRVVAICQHKAHMMLQCSTPKASTRLGSTMHVDSRMTRSTFCLWNLWTISGSCVDQTYPRIPCQLSCLSLLRHHNSDRTRNVKFCWTIVTHSWPLETWIATSIKKQACDQSEELGKGATTWLPCILTDHTHWMVLRTLHHLFSTVGSKFWNLIDFFQTRGTNVAIQIALCNIIAWEVCTCIHISLYRHVYVWNDICEQNINASFQEMALSLHTLF